MYRGNYTAPYNSTSYADYTPQYVSTDGGSASDRAAEVTRAQWKDYQNTYIPLENLLMSQTTYKNPGLISAEVGAGTSAINTAYDVARQTQQNARARYGMQTSAAQLDNMSKVESLGKTAAVVGAANNIRQRLADRNSAIAGAGIPASRNYDYSGGTAQD